MATAQPTVIINGFLDVSVNAFDNQKVDVSMEYRMLFIPTSSSAAKTAQTTLILNGDFTKQQLHDSSIAAIIVQVAQEGVSITADRIFVVGDLS